MSTLLHFSLIYQNVLRNNHCQCFCLVCQLNHSLETAHGIFWGGFFSVFIVICLMLFANIFIIKFRVWLMLYGVTLQMHVISFIVNREGHEDTAAKITHRKCLNSKVNVFFFFLFVFRMMRIKRTDACKQSPRSRMKLAAQIFTHFAINWIKTQEF